MTDVEVLAFVGAIGAIIVIGVLVVRFGRGTKKVGSKAVSETSSIINDSSSKKKVLKM